MEVRLDRWLWAARFFRTRALATAAVKGGHVHLGGVRAKPARNVRVGDQLQITRGRERFEVEVLGLSEQRGPASVARELYRESEESRARREREAAERSALRRSDPAPRERPDKRTRRRIIRLKGEGG